MIITQTSGVVDITSLAEVVSYQFVGSDRGYIVGVRVDVGDDANPIVGGANYTVRLSLNDRIVVPDPPIVVASGVTKVTLVSRQVLVMPQDILSLSIEGMPGDSQVYIATSLLNFTPLTASEFVNDVVPILETAMGELSGDLVKAIGKINVSPTVNVLGPGASTPTAVNILGPCARPVTTFKKPIGC